MLRKAVLFVVTGIALAFAPSSLSRFSSSRLNMMVDGLKIDMTGKVRMFPLNFPGYV
jgi:hypothetical protein